MNDLLRSWPVVAVVRRWWVVVLAAVLAAAVLLAVQLAAGRTYQAAVDVLPKQARTEVNFDARIRTVSPDNAQSALAPTASAERRHTLTQLVRSADVERAVREALGDALPPALRAPGALLSRVQGRLALRSEVITIVVEAPTAELAERLATAWGREYERHVNRLFAGDGARGPVEAQEVEAARRTYQTAEDELTTFLATSTLREDTRRSAATQQLLNDTVAYRQAGVADLFDQMRRVDLLLDQALALQQQLAQVQDAGASASTQLALTLLKAQAFGSVPPIRPIAGLEPEQHGGPLTARGSSGRSGEASGRQDGGGSQGAATQGSASLPPPTTVQLQTPPLAPATLGQQRADVAATIEALLQWRGRLQQEVQDRSRELVATSDAAGTTASRQLEAELRELQGRVAAQAAKFWTLQQTRDLALETYSSLLKRSEEARVALVVGTGNEVVLASQTVVAVPRPRGLSLRLPLAAAAGAAVGVLAILALAAAGRVRRIVQLQESEGARPAVVPVIADAPSDGAPVRHGAPGRLAGTGNHSSAGH